VGTRWYRAPEIALIEKQYDTASDIWSLGCTLFELVKVATEGSAMKPIKRVLFPGNSSYPLSPCAKNRLVDSATGISKEDQMVLILKVLGKASEEELSFLTDEDSKTFVRNISEDFEGKSFATLLPEC
jgi:mitogen-activated protein kinase 1/3